MTNLNIRAQTKTDKLFPVIKKSYFYKIPVIEDSDNFIMKLSDNAYQLFVRASGYELALCTSINKACQKTFIKAFFTLVSRLGDGVFWYITMLAIPFLLGLSALSISLHMLGVAAVNYLIYKLIKSNTKRPRPYASDKNIDLGGRVLDQYSFPSGHTLHAVAFTIVLIHYFPQLGIFLIPFTALIALSRVVLGLHYPTDVICGIVIGAAVSHSSLALIPYI